MNDEVQAKGREKTVGDKAVGDITEPPSIRLSRLGSRIFFLIMIVSFLVETTITGRGRQSRLALANPDQDSRSILQVKTATCPLITS